jgi:hypothetical protein
LRQTNKSTYCLAIQNIQTLIFFKNPIDFYFYYAIIVLSREGKKARVEKLKTQGVAISLSDKVLPPQGALFCGIEM